MTAAAASSAAAAPAQCVWIRANGKRCKSPAADGRLCTWHVSGALERVKYWNRAAVTDDVPLQDHLVYQLKMSLTMLRELEFQVLDLGLGVEAWQHEVHHKTVRRGTDDKNQYREVETSVELGAHPLLLQYQREREHHAKVVQLCIQAGFAQRQLEVIERYVESLVSSQTMLAEALGHDPDSPEVRAKIMDVVRRKHLELQQSSPRAAPALEVS